MLSENDHAWWRRPDSLVDETDPRAHEKLLLVLKDIERTQSYRKREMLAHAAIYGDFTGQGLQVDSYSSRGPGRDSILGLNVSRSVVDAVASRIYAKVPKLAYVTEGGDYEKQHNAEMLERGVEGVLYQADGDEVATEFGRRGAIYGTGFVRCEPDWDSEKVTVANWQPWERLFDDGESLYGDAANGGPRCEYTHRYWDKYVLLHYVQNHLEKMGGDDARAGLVCEKIERLSGEKDDDAEFGFQQRALRCAVYEGLHRPSGRGAEDGRYVLAVANVVVIDAMVDWDHLPFASYRWSRGVAGPYGQGLIEQGKGIQKAINKLVRQIEHGHHLITGKWLVEASSKVVSAHINNDLSTILKYTGSQPPAYVTPAIIAPEVYQHLWALKAQYYQLASVNEQAAAAQIPAGMESGEAQRQYADHQDAALLQRGKAFERAWRDVGGLVAKAAKQLANESVYEVRSRRDGEDGFEAIDWKNLDDPDGYQLIETPTSQLPGTISGRVSLAYDLQKLGDVDNVDIMEVIGMADTLKLTRRKLAWRKRVERDVDLMLREGDTRLPDVFMNLDGAMEIVLEEYNLAVNKDVEDDRLQLLRDYLQKLDELKPKAPAPAPQAMNPTGGGLMAPGQAAPMLPHPGGVPGAPPPQAPPQAA